MKIIRDENPLWKKYRINQNQRKFIEEYLKCLNGTQAYMIAYPDASYKTACVNSSKLLSKKHIKEEFERRFEESLNSDFPQAEEAEIEHKIIHVTIAKSDG